MLDGEALVRQLLELAPAVRELTTKLTHANPTLASHPGFDPMLSAQEAARYCACHPKTLKQDALAGKLPSVRRGEGGAVRFRLSDLNNYLDTQRIEPRRGVRMNEDDAIDWGA